MKKLITLLALAFCLDAGAQCPITITGNTVVCAGSTTTLTASGPTTYSWAPTTGLSSTTGAVVTITPTVNATYTVTGTTGTCIATNTVAVVVNPTPSAPVYSGSNPVMACQGTPITLSVTPAGGSTLIWYVGSIYIHAGNTFTPSTSFFGTTVYSVLDSAMTPTGCTSSPITVTVAVTPGPSVTYTLVADAAPHTWDAYPAQTGGTPPYTFVWNWGDGTNSTAAYPSHTYSVAGTYSICVTITDANGCSSTYCHNDAVSRLANNSPLSTMVYVNVKNSAAGIEQFANINEQVNIYPNPNNGSFVIEPQNTLYNVHCTVYDVNGKAVLTQTINAKTSIDASSLNEGIYNISLQSTEGVINKRLVIVR
jgi:type IX secretion system substrate protein/PKD domain-containing protein